MNYNSLKELHAELDRLKNIDISEISESEATNMEDISLDEGLTVNDRILAFLEQAVNPYFFNINGIIVKTSFSDSGRSLQQCMEEYLAAEMMVHKDQK